MYWRVFLLNGRELMTLEHGPCVFRPSSLSAGICVYPCSSLLGSDAVSEGVLTCSVGAAAFAACCISGVSIYTGVND